MFPGSSDLCRCGWFDGWDAGAPVGGFLPNDLCKVIVIAATARSSPQQIAFNEVGRRAIMADPAWLAGNYLLTEPPVRGLALARMIGHITYLSDGAMHDRFGRNLQNRESIGYGFATEFQVESYLHHQGDSFTRRFDANSYLYITRAIDYFDLAERSLAAGFAGGGLFLVFVSSDWLYPPYQSEEIVDALAARSTSRTRIRSN